MKTQLLALALMAPMALLAAPAAQAQAGQAIAGLWDATLNLNGKEIPFKMEFAGDGANVKGWFFNGDDRETSNSGKLENGSLVLNFDSYASVLRLNLKDGALDGVSVQWSENGQAQGSAFFVRGALRPEAPGAPR